MGCTASAPAIEEIKSGETVVDFLKKNAFFRDLKDTASLEKAARLFQVVRYDVHPGETKVIIKRGDPGDSLFILARGTVEVRLQSPPTHPVPHTKTNL